MLQDLMTKTQKRPNTEPQGVKQISSGAHSIAFFPFYRIEASKTLLFTHSNDFFTHLTYCLLLFHAFGYFSDFLQHSLTRVTCDACTVEEHGVAKMFDPHNKIRSLFFIDPHPKNSDFEHPWVEHKSPKCFHDVVWAVKDPTTTPPPKEKGQ